MGLLPSSGYGSLKLCQCRQLYISIINMILSRDLGVAAGPLFAEL